MVWKILVFILLSCQNDQENERKNKEKFVSEAEKIVQTELKRLAKIEQARTDSIKKIPRTKTTKPSILAKKYLYFICDNDKVILVKKDVASGEFSTFWLKISTVLLQILCTTIILYVFG